MSWTKHAACKMQGVELLDRNGVSAAVLADDVPGGATDSECASLVSPADEDRYQMVPSSPSPPSSSLSSRTVRVEAIPAADMRSYCGRIRAALTRPLVVGLLVGLAVVSFAAMEVVQALLGEVLATSTARVGCSLCIIIASVSLWLCMNPYVLVKLLPRARYASLAAWIKFTVACFVL